MDTFAWSKRRPPKLLAFVAADTASAKAYSELHHYRIFLDETGCHEVFAQSFTAA